MVCWVIGANHEGASYHEALTVILAVRYLGKGQELG
jgi:hypothetical protein